MNIVQYWQRLIKFIKDLFGKKVKVETQTTKSINKIFPKVNTPWKNEELISYLEPPIKLKGESDEDYVIKKWVTNVKNLNTFLENRKNKNCNAPISNPLSYNENIILISFLKRTQIKVDKELVYDYIGGEKVWKDYEEKMEMNKIQ